MKSFSYTAYGKPAVLIAVAASWTHAATAEVQIVGEDGNAGSTRPVVAVATTIARRRTVPVAGIDEVIWEGAPVVGACSASGCTHLLI